MDQKNLRIYSRGLKILTNGVKIINSGQTLILKRVRNMHLTKSKKILVVEDDADISLSVKQILQMYGYEVATAFDGQEALDKLRTGCMPNLIFLDLMMPNVDGFQFYAEFQKDDKINHIPIVVLTADGNTIEKGKKVNAKAALKKPANIDDILDAAKKYAC
jgi:CheY-like chemotaxis protein